MHRSAHIQALTISIVLVFLFSFTIQAQERRRVSPSFPISAGEKMIVIPGMALDNVSIPLTAWTYFSNLDRYVYHLTLPVGTTLKRMVVEAKDADGTDSNYLRFVLIRFPNGGGSNIALREVNTLGHSSPGLAQFVSNPLNHTIMQGWVYGVLLAGVGDVSGTNFAIGVIKIIYEP